MGHGSRTTQLIHFSVPKKQNYYARWWVPTVILTMYSHLLIPLGCWPCWQHRRARRTERAKVEDDVEAVDGNEQEPGKITASRGRREQAVPPALAWLWRLEEEETEEMRQTLNVNPTVKVGTIVCWLSGHQVAYFFIYRKKTVRKMRLSAILLTRNVHHISD